MSMLVRYKKTGGFQQLLTLLESCSPSKREQLMKVIQSEDPGWAALIKAKLLTIEKLFAWDPLTLGEVTQELPIRVLAAALHGMGPDAVNKATYTMDHKRRRDVENMIKDLTPAAGEIEAARVKLLARVRELEREKRLDLGKVDPSLAVRDLKVA